MQDDVFEATPVDFEQLMSQMDRIEGDGQEYALLAQKLTSNLICYDIPLARRAIRRLKATRQFEPALELYTSTGSEEDESLCRHALVSVPQEDVEDARRQFDVQALIWKGDIGGAIRIAEEADDPILIMSLIDDIEDHARKDPTLFAKYKDIFRDHSSFKPEGPDGWCEEPEEDADMGAHDSSPRIRVKRSVARLARLIELNAPSLVIRNEALLLLEMGEFGEAQRGLKLIQEPMPYPEDILGRIAVGLIERSRIEPAKAVLRLLTDPLIRAKVMLAFFLRRLRAARTLAS